MDRQERVELMSASILQLGGEGDGFVIFMDQDYPDNYVQIAADGLIEVTSRNFRNSKLPKLTPEQIARIVALGFSQETDPNHQGEVDIDEPMQIAELCEQLFSILGSSPTFELEIETGI